MENAISTAMDRLVEKHGILGITANMLMAEAGIESPVFYNRYGSIDDLIYEYVSEKDFWIAGKLPYKDIEKDGPEEYYVNTLLKLGDMLKESKFTRDTLIWELSSDSEAACKIAGLKEMENEALLVYYSKVFKGVQGYRRGYPYSHRHAYRRDILAEPAQGQVHFLRYRPEYKG